MLQTKMTEILGIKYPIQCGTMQSITTAELVAPVANAGGLCCIPAATFQTKQAFMDEIKKTRDNHIKGTSRIPRKEVSWYVRERASIKP